MTNYKKLNLKKKIFNNTCDKELIKQLNRIPTQKEIIEYRKIKKQNNE
jgi:hypothetical protein